MKKNIAFINIFNGDAGGGEHYLINLIKLLQKNTDHNLYLLSPDIDNISLDFIGNKHIKINGVSKNSFLKNIKKIDKTIKDINKAIKIYNFDKVVINGDRATLLSPFIIGDFVKIGIRHMPIDSIAKKIISKIAFKYLDTLVTISEFHKLNYIKSTKSKVKINVIYNAIDENFFSLHNMPETSKIIFTQVGTLENRKGIMDTIECFKNLYEMNKNIELHIIGIGDLYEKIKDFIKINKLENAIFMHGFQQNIKDFLIKSHIILLPSYNEGLPLVILEALSVGRPIISTKVAAIPELIINNVNGFLIEPGNRRMLETSMNNFIKNTDLINKMHKNIIENRNEKYSIKNWSSEWLELLK